MPFDLKREDYEEPRCLLEMHPETVGIPTGRVIEKLDEYLNRNDFASAERHLRYWLEEAESVNDGRGRLTVLNEQIGLYRKMEKESEALQAIENALALAEAPDMDGTVTCGGWMRCRCPSEAHCLRDPCGTVSCRGGLCGAPCCRGTGRTRPSPP